jgi:hypothetical protein
MSVDPERHVCEPSGQHVAVNGPIVFSEVLAPETVNINCTFDAGYSFVGYTVDPLYAPPPKSVTPPPVCIHILRVCYVGVLCVRAYRIRRHA